MASHAILILPRPTVALTFFAAAGGSYLGTASATSLSGPSVARRILRPYRIPVFTARADAEIEMFRLVGRCQQRVGTRCEPLTVPRWMS